jgi:hypothetical protein
MSGFGDVGVSGRAFDLESLSEFEKSDRFFFGLGSSLARLAILAESDGVPPPPKCL